jgi:hypothetical protein
MGDAFYPTGGLGSAAPRNYAVAGLVYFVTHLGRNLRFKGSPLCDRPRSKPSVRQAALEQLPTPMPFTTGSFRACASGSRTADNGVHQNRRWDAVEREAVIRSIESLSALAELLAA